MKSFFFHFFFFFVCYADAGSVADGDGRGIPTTVDPAESLDLFMVPLPPQRHDNVMVSALSDAFSMAWYREFVVSRHRRFDYLVLFTSSGCEESQAMIQEATEDIDLENANQEADGSVEEQEEQEDLEHAICEGSVNDQATDLQIRVLQTALIPLYDQPTRFPFVQSLRVVHIPSHKFPEITRFHDVQVFPSLMLLFRRDSPFFQRRNLTKPATTLNPFVALPAFGAENQPLDGQQGQQEAQLEVTQLVTSLLMDVQKRLLFTSPAALSQMAANDPFAASNSSSMWTRLGFVMAFLGIFAVCFGGISNQLIQTIVDSVQATVCQRRHWFIVSALVMYISLSGTIFSLLNRVPWFYASPMHGIRLVYPSGGNQFLLEAAVAGLWGFWVSLWSYGIAEILPRLEKPSSKDQLLQVGLMAIVIPSFFLWMTFFEKNSFLLR